MSKNELADAAKTAKDAGPAVEQKRIPIPPKMLAVMRPVWEELKQAGAVVEMKKAELSRLMSVVADSMRLENPVTCNVEEGWMAKAAPPAAEPVPPAPEPPAEK